MDGVKAEHAQLLEEAFQRAKVKLVAIHQRLLTVLKDEAATFHSQELSALRAQSTAAISDIQISNQATLEQVKAEHAASLETEVSSLSKQITKLNVELKATQDDLAKSKAALQASRAEVESLAKQRDEAREQADATPELSAEHSAEIVRLSTALSHAVDDLSAANEMLALTKSSMTEMSEKHSQQLEEIAQKRAEELQKLHAIHDEEISKLATDKTDLVVKLSDLEGDLATTKSDLEASKLASPKANGNGAGLVASPSVTKEELSKLHEAHTLKIHDLEAEHEKVVRQLKEQLEAASSKATELQQDVERKAMEIQYMEQDQDESQEQITRYVDQL